MDPEKAVGRAMLLVKWDILCRDTVDKERWVIRGQGKGKSYYDNSYSLLRNVKKKNLKRRGKTSIFFISFPL